MSTNRDNAHRQYAPDRPVRRYPLGLRVIARAPRAGTVSLDGGRIDWREGDAVYFEGDYREVESVSRSNNVIVIRVPAVNDKA